MSYILRLDIFLASSFAVTSMAASTQNNQKPNTGGGIRFSVLHDSFY